MYIALGQEQTTPAKFLMPSERPYPLGQLSEVSKRSLQTVIFIYIFPHFLHVHNHRAGADNPLGTKF